jgi:glycosyltransferase involved in cell wall biosynthesis
MEKESSQPLVSVIIPAYNEEDYIEKTILSIINSSYKNFEIIIVCDSCMDKTEEISKKYTDNTYKVEFKNIAQTRNYGASKAKGDIFVFSDADTICSSNYMLSIVNVIKLGFDYGCAKMLSETGTWKGKFIIGRFNYYNKSNKTVGGNCFAEEGCFTKINGFDENMVKGEDTDFGNRLSKSGAKYIYIKDSYLVTSERRFKKYGYFNYFINSLKDGTLYFLNKKKYKEIYKKT